MRLLLYNKFFGLEESRGRVGPSPFPKVSTPLDGKS